MSEVETVVEGGSVSGEGGSVVGTEVKAPEVKEKRVRVSQTDFLTAWEETVDGLTKGTLQGSGVAIVAKRLGLEVTTVQQRSTKYRSQYGLPLSNMPRGGGAKFNATKAVDTLAAIKARLNAPKDTEKTDGETAPETSTENAPSA